MLSNESIATLRKHLIDTELYDDTRMDLSEKCLFPSIEFLGSKLIEGEVVDDICFTHVDIKNSSIEHFAGSVILFTNKRILIGYRYVSKFLFKTSVNEACEIIPFSETNYENVDAIFNDKGNPVTISTKKHGEITFKVKRFSY